MWPIVVSTVAAVRAGARLTAQSAPDSKYWDEQEKDATSQLEESLQYLLVGGGFRYSGRT